MSWWNMLVACTVTSLSASLQSASYSSKSDVYIAIVRLLCSCISLQSVLCVSAAVVISQQPVVPNLHPACTNFTVGNDQLRQFYSPGWPLKYPKSINCTRVLTAPIGQLISVDFRDSFHLEPSTNCENDYLMVRDGKEAYSREIGRVCGHAFPRIITSTGRYLWLRFRSDESIQYNGFKAVYDFVEAEGIVRAPDCTFTLTGPEAIVSTENISAAAISHSHTSSMALDCKWRIDVTPGREIQISFKEFDLDKPNECDVNFVEILYGPELSLTRKQIYCSSKADSVKLGTDNDVTFRYFASADVVRSSKANILAVVTELRPRLSDDTCTLDEFDCDDLYCINNTLVCNGNFNCDKQLDEKSNCNRDQQRSVLAFLTTDANIVILTIGCGLLFGMCFSMFWNCVRKLREDCKEKEESVRRSQLAGLDGGGRGRSRTTLAESGCYVPTLEMKPVLCSTRSVTGSDTDDRGCQTAAHRRRHASCESTPPPPPPPPTRLYQHAPPISPFPEDHYQTRAAVAPPPRTPPPPPPELCDLHRPRTLPRVADCTRVVAAAVPLEALSAPSIDRQPTPGRRFRAEAVIQMAARPNSMYSAKSAPDVIVKL